MRPSETKVPTFALASRRDGPDVRKRKVSEVENFSLALVSASHIILWSHGKAQIPVLRVRVIRGFRVLRYILVFGGFFLCNRV